MNSMEQEKKSIEDVIKIYVKGYLAADKETMLQSFHGETRLYAISKNQIAKTEMETWLVAMDERKAKGDVRQARLEIPLIDVAGTAATAKVKLYFEKRVFTDYLSLLKSEAGWKIVGKIYSIEELA